MLRMTFSRAVKDCIHKIAALFGMEFFKENSKLKLQKRFYIGSDHLKDISKIAGGAKNISVCIDGGAHRGETAFLFAKAFPKATIYSFEPEANNYQSLSDTVSSSKRIIPINLALGETTTSGTFIVNYNSQTGSLLAAAQGSEKYVQNPTMMQPSSIEKVSIVSLSDWVKKNGIESIDLLKLDLQGYELKALSGAKSLLSNKRISFVYLEVNFIPAYEGQASLTELYEYLHQFGYRLVGLYPSEFNALQFHYRCGGDLLFVLEDLKVFNTKGSVTT